MCVIFLEHGEIVVIRWKGDFDRSMQVPHMRGIESESTAVFLFFVFL